MSAFHEQSQNESNAGRSENRLCGFLADIVLCLPVQAVQLFPDFVPTCVREARQDVAPGLRALAAFHFVLQLLQASDFFAQCLLAEIAGPDVPRALRGSLRQLLGFRGGRLLRSGGERAGLLGLRPGLRLNGFVHRVGGGFGVPEK